jgi:hypothetical protein
MRISANLQYKTAIAKQPHGAFIKKLLIRKTKHTNISPNA